MRRALTDRSNDGSHPGLLLQRYLAQPTGQQTEPQMRRALLDSALRAVKSAPVRELYAGAFERWRASFEATNLHRAARLTTANRLVVGLGTENVLEAGLRLHHTYGIPTIPGSALKGLAAHYCHDVWGQRHDAEAPDSSLDFRRGGRYHSLLFGTTDDAGAIVFHDAWITPESLAGGALCLDVMTPHHPTWQTNDAAPTDFDSPVPVSFLSMSGTFDVRVSWSGPADTLPAQAEAWTELAMTLLKAALAERGVGGKTRSGYGRLVDAPAPAPTPRRPIDVPTPGQTVECVLLKERTRKGGWKARHEPSGLSGPIQNASDVLDDKTAGDALELIVASANQREIAFKYPTDSEQSRAASAPRGRNKRVGPRGKGGR
jgi:CRISPR-associated protein Cmr6